MDIEQSKKEWELNRLKHHRELEERKAELEEDDMLYTYSTEDGMNKVPPQTDSHRAHSNASVSIPPAPSRKSGRPPKPKQLESESEEERRPLQPEPRKRGRPKGSKKAVKTDNTNTIKLKSTRCSTEELWTLKRKPGSKTYIVSTAASK